MSTAVTRAPVFGLATTRVHGRPDPCDRVAESSIPRTGQTLPQRWKFWLRNVAHDFECRRLNACNPYALITIKMARAVATNKCQLPREQSRRTTIVVESVVES